MNRLATYCYALSAAAFACIVQNSSSSSFWDGRPMSAIMLSSTIPFCVASGWLIEHRPITYHPYVYRFSATVALLFGSFSLALFNSTISKKLGIGFLGGMFLAAAFVNALQKFAPDKPAEKKDEEGK